MTSRILAMLEIICYNAIRQNVKGVHDDTTTENPGGCDSGVFSCLKYNFKYKMEIL